MSARHATNMKEDSAIRFLRHAASSAGMVPSLKGVADTVLEIADLVMRFKTCTEEWRDFRAYIQSTVATTLQAVESANAEQSEVKGHVEKLRAVLQAIIKRIETRQKDSLWLRMGHFLDHPIAIAEMRQEIDDAIGLFKLGTAVRTEVNTEIIQRETAKIVQWTERQSKQANAAPALDPLLNKLQYPKGASWDPLRVCLPNTRKNIIGNVLSWVNNIDGTPDTSIFLLTGVAGSGKSAIAHSVSQQLCESKQLATSFFFDRETAERNTPRGLISTIAVDLSRRDDGLASRIISAIREEESLIGAPIARQFQDLILSPSEGFSCSQPLVVVLDALDEGCDADLLHILCESASKLPPSIRIFLTSRMSPDIERLSRKSHVHSVSLDIYEKNNLEDIALFVPHKLKQVAEQHDLGDDWPDVQLVLSFQARAEGLFLWVATTCNYLKSCYYPQEELDMLLSESYHTGSSAESKMDTLYATILEACNWNDHRFSDSCRMLLGAAVATKSPLTLQSLNALYQRVIMGSELALRQLSPLLSGLTNKPTTEPVRFIHQSLRDFLTLRAADLNVSRGGHHYAIDEKKNSCALASLCINLMNRELDSSIPGLGYSSKSELELPGIPLVDVKGVPDQLMYSCRFWIDHVLDVEPHSVLELAGQLEQFIEKTLVLWMEFIAAYGRYEGLLRVQAWMERGQIYPALRSQVYNKDLAPICHNLAERFKYMDRREEALIAARDEVAIYRELAADGYHGILAGLARSLSSLSIYLKDLDYREDALTAASEAVAIQRELATTDTEGLKADLAKSLHRVSIGYRDLGRAEDALEAIQEAVKIQRNLAGGAECATTYTADTARFLNVHSCCLTDIGRHEEALTISQEVVGLRRQLAKDQPAVFTSDLANSLYGLALALSSLGWTEKALATAQEALELHRQLVKERPAVFTPKLVNSLHSISKYLSDLGRYKKALPITEEEVGLCRHLAGERPAVFTSDLAHSLDALASNLSDLGFPDKALDSAQESIELRRQLAKQRPSVFTSDLADSLHNLVYYLLKLGGHDEALTTSKEVVGLCRKLSEQRPTVFTSKLADSLHNLSCGLSEQGSYSEALEVIQEAVAFFRPLAAERPAVFNPNLALGLDQLSYCLYQLNLDGDAVIASRESVGLYRPLAEQYPAVHSSRFFDALDRLAEYLSHAGRNEEALLVRQEIEALSSTDPVSE